MGKTPSIISSNRYFALSNITTFLCYAITVAGIMSDKCATVPFYSRDFGASVGQTCGSDSGCVQRGCYFSHPHSGSPATTLPLIGSHWPWPWYFYPKPIISLRAPTLNQWNQRRQQITANQKRRRAGPCGMRVREKYGGGGIGLGEGGKFRGYNCVVFV